MTRQNLIERILRHVYGEQPTDDSNITLNLVNAWMNDGIGLAAKQNWKESIPIDGVAYANNSFYTSFSGIPIIATPENFIYQLTLPQIPFGLGKNEGVGSCRFISADGQYSYDGLPLSQNQVSYRKSLKQVPNKICYWPEGIFIYAETVIPLWQYTAVVRMVSGGDSTNLGSILNVPDDYIPVIMDYCSKMLIAERLVRKDAANDGVDQQ